MKLISVRWTCLLLLLAAIAVSTNVAADSQGRWKVDSSGNCVFDENDDGPDQCMPPELPGRWKFAGDGSCYFEPNDWGPDQCVAPAPAPASVKRE